jgi:hypothetical protein
MELIHWLHDAMGGFLFELPEGNEILPKFDDKL